MPDTWKQRLAAWKQRFRAFGKATFSVAVALVGIAGVGAGAFAIYFYWNWLNPVIMGNNPEHLRNLILMTAGLITFIISIWRARIADKQAKASNIQAEATIEQIKIAAQSQITDRFTRAVEQLGKSKDDLLFLRIGAIQALERIGNDSLDDLPAIIRLLARFARETSIANYNKGVKHHPAQIADTSPDVAEAVASLTRLNDNHFEFLRDWEISIDLLGSYFPKLYLPDYNLSGFQLIDCYLGNAALWDANLRGAILIGANLNNAFLQNADLSNAFLQNADLNSATLRGADFSGADIEDINLDPKTRKPREGTTELLSEIIYDKDNPPKNCPEGVTLPPPRDG